MTAVEFLESQYNFNKQLFPSDFEQAKEMEKEQILAAHSDWSRITENLPTRSAEQYYNETFKSE